MQGCHAMGTIKDESAAATEAKGTWSSGGAAERHTAGEVLSSDDSRPAKRQRVEEEEQEKEGACGGHAEAKPAPSRWYLRGDACAKVKEQPGECTEAAGRWLFEDAREGGELTDMEFVLDSGRRVRGHKSWLSARCEYIRGMLCCGMREGQTGVVRVRDCCEGVFVALLEFIYTGRLGDTCLGQEWHELWALADLFGMEGMVERLLSAVTRDNVEEAARVAVERGMRPLMERCVSALPPKPASGDEARRVIRTVDLLEFGEEHVHMQDEWLLLKNAGGIDAVVGAMRKNRQDAFIQQRGCAALMNMELFWVDDDQTRGATKVSYDAVVEALLAHPANAPVQWIGCKALRNLLYRKFWRQQSDGNARGVDAVLRALKAHGTDAMVQRTGLEALKWFVFDNDSSRRHAVANGGFEVAMAALENHRADAQVQKRGCMALRGMNCVGSAEALEAVVRAIKDHSDDEGVQEEGCEALIRLVLKSVEEEGMRRVCAAGGIEAVMQAVKTFSAYSNVGTSAIGFLYQIRDGCDDESNRRAREAMGIEAVLESLKVSNNGAEDVQEAAMQAMSLFRFFDWLDDDEDLSSIDAMWKHWFRYSDADILEHVDVDDHTASPCRCFDCYFSHIDRHFDVKVWRVEITVLLIKGCIGSSRIQALGCQVLFDLFADHNNCRHAERLGAISALEAAIRRHPGHQCVQIHGRNALRRWGEYACPSVSDHYRPL